MKSTPKAIRQIVGIHQLEHDAGGSAHGHLALLPSSDGSKIADTQQHGQLRLGEAVSLADGFEFGWGHSGDALVEVHHKPVAKVRIAPHRDGQSLFGCGVALRANRPRAHRVLVVARDAVGLRVELPCVGLLRHRHSPLSGGASPRSVEPLSGRMSYLSTHFCNYFSPPGVL